MFSVIRTAIKMVCQSNSLSNFARFNARKFVNGVLKRGIHAVKGPKFEAVHRFDAESDLVLCHLFGKPVSIRTERTCVWPYPVKFKRSA
jgi:hypothetical protein